MTTDIADSRLGMRAQYERCGLALARLRAIANPGDGSPSGYAVDAAEEAMEQVLAGLRDASRTVDERARRPATAVFLRRRLTRLEYCADDVRAAFAEATGPYLRRRVQHFCALATASWLVCLSLYPNVRPASRTSLLPMSPNTSSRPRIGTPRNRRSSSTIAP